MNYKQELKQVNKLIDQAENINSLLRRSEKRIGGNASFTISGLVGRNLFGDFIRNSKVSSINSTISRLQKELLTFHKNLMLYDKELAQKVDLPVKLEEFTTSRTVFSDIILRSRMRLKELEVGKLQTKMKTIIKRLYKEREKINYNIKKEIELESYK